MHSVDDVELKVRGNLISIEEGARELMEKVYENPVEFGIHLDQDQLHEFLISMLKSFRRIFSVYKPECGSFYSFLYGNIKGNLSTWKRKQLKENSRENCFVQSSCMNYDDKALQYEMNEYNSLLSCPDTLSNDSVFLKNFSRMLNLHIDEASDENNSHKCTPERQIAHEGKKMRDIVLLLFLKSSFYVDEEMTRKVSLLTEISMKKLEEMKEKVLSEMDKRIERHSQILNYRNSSYFFHQKYLLELENKSPYSGPVESIAGKYERQTVRWNKVCEEIREGKFSVVPTNRLVAEVMGISEHKVRYLIQTAADRMKDFSIREYYLSHKKYFRMKSEAELQ